MSDRVGGVISGAPAKLSGDVGAGGDGPSAAPARTWRDGSLWNLTSVRFKEFLREPEALFWTFGFPIVLAIALGIAFRNRPADVVHVGVVRNASSGTVLTSLRADKRLVAEDLSADSAHDALRTGRVALVVVPTATGVEYEFDDTRPDARTARSVADDAVQRGAGRRDPVGVSERQVRERGSRYIDFVIPGLIGMNIMGDGIWGLGFAIVDARRKNLLKRLVATPMPRWQYLLAFMLARLVLVTTEIIVILGFAVAVFGVPLRGSIVTLAAVCLAATFAFGGLGLLIAARPRTIEAASGLMNLTMMPMWVLSGVFFSSENFPRVVQPLIKALPLTATIDALRATMLRGASLPTLAPELLVLAVWIVGCFALALKLFRWR
jgi:ABC-2 type transport system permease protein